MVCAHVSLVYFELLENKDGCGVFTSCGLCESWRDFLQGEGETFFFIIISFPFLGMSVELYPLVSQIFPYQTKMDSAVYQKDLIISAAYSLGTLIFLMTDLLRKLGIPLLTVFQTGCENAFLNVWCLILVI